jgi:hypothetical protein
MTNLLDAALASLRNMRTDLLGWSQISDIEAEIQRLVEMGLVADSGRRKWSIWTGRHEIVWTRTEAGDRLASELNCSAQSHTEGSQR